MLIRLNFLAATYQGSITVTPSFGGQVIIPVTLQVGSNTLAVTPASLAFTYSLGGTVPPVQTGATYQPAFQGYLYSPSQ